MLSPFLRAVMMGRMAGVPLRTRPQKYLDCQQPRACSCCPGPQAGLSYSHWQAQLLGFGCKEFPLPWVNLKTVQHNYHPNKQGHETTSMYCHLKSFFTNQGNISSLFTSTATAPIYPKNALLDSLLSTILLLLLAPLFSQASRTACPPLRVKQECNLYTHNHCWILKNISSLTHSYSCYSNS